MRDKRITTECDPAEQIRRGEELNDKHGQEGDATDQDRAFEQAPSHRIATNSIGNKKEQRVVDRRGIAYCHERCSGAEIEKYVRRQSHCADDQENQNRGGQRCSRDESLMF